MARIQFTQSYCGATLPISARDKVVKVVKVVIMGKSRLGLRSDEGRAWELGAEKVGRKICLVSLRE